MKNKLYRYGLVAYKLIFALLAFGAVENEIVTLSKRGAFNGFNFFSYFTTQSNLFAAVILVLGAAALLTHTKSRFVDGLRGAATLYMVLTGIVFSVLLSGLDPSILTAVPSDNTILHYIIPVALLLDWLLDRPTHYIRYRTVGLWLIYPIVYVAYTLIRGPIAHWYPYPFINPTIAGYPKVLVTSLIIAIGVIIVGLLVRAYSLVGRGKHHVVKS